MQLGRKLELIKERQLYGHIYISVSQMEICCTGLKLNVAYLPALLEMSIILSPFSKTLRALFSWRRNDQCKQCSDCIASVWYFGAQCKHAQYTGGSRGTTGGTFIIYIHIHTITCV